MSGASCPTEWFSGTFAVSVYFTVLDPDMEAFAPVIEELHGG